MALPVLNPPPLTTPFAQGDGTPSMPWALWLGLLQRNVRAASAVVGTGITALTGEVSATGSGSVAASVVSVDGSSAASIHAAELLANAATSANTPNTIVKRDSSGNFSGNEMPANTIKGNNTGGAANAADLTATEAAALLGILELNVLWFGADPTGVSDSTTAFQDCINFAQSIATSSRPAPAILAPSGNYLCGTLLNKSGIKIRGDGRWSTTISTSRGNEPTPWLLSVPDIDATKMPLTTALATGSGGALLLDQTNWTANSWLINLRSWNAYMEGLNGISHLNIRFFMKVPVTIGFTAELFHIAFIQGSTSINEEHALEVLLLDAGQFQFALTTTNGAVSCFVTLPTDAATHHYSLDYDGTDIRIFVDGVQGASAAQTGGLVITPRMGMWLGPTMLGTVSGGTFTSAVPCTLDSFQVSNVSRNTSNFTPPTAKHANDSSTLALFNFANTVQNQLECELFGSDTCIVLLENALGTSGSVNPATDVSDLSLWGYQLGAYACDTARARFEGLNISASNGIIVKSFGSRLLGCNISASQFFGYALSTAAGDHVISDFEIGGGGAPWPILVEDTDGVTIRDGYATLGEAPIFINNGTSISISRVLSSFEGGTTPPANSNIDVMNSNGVLLDGFEVNSSLAIPGIRLCGAVDIEVNSLFASGATTTPIFGAHPLDKLDGTAPKFVTVTKYVPYSRVEGLTPVSPLFYAPLSVDRFLWLDTPNGNGQATATGATATVTVAFPLAEPDTGYRVALCPVGSTGSPAAGSNRVLSVVKSTGGFVATLEAAPGTSNSVTFDWQAQR